MENLKDKFYALLMGKLKVEKEELKSKARFVDLGADCLNRVELPKF